MSLLQSVKTGSKTHPTSHSKDTGGSGLFPGVKWPLCDVEHCHHLVPSSGMSGAAPPKPPSPS
jgi:hypothetical protein